MRAPSATIALIFVTAGLLVPSVSRVVAAQTPGRNPAAAQVLYDDARQLVQAGKYAEACPKFKASYELDPGGGTLLNLADCYEKAGETALAWTTFKEALVVAQRDNRSDRVAFANQHIGLLESRLARLTVQVARAARVPGLSIAVDGAPLADVAWGVAVPVDPGTHVVRAEAPGKRPFETSIEVSSASAARVAVDVPPLEDEGADHPAGAVATATAPAETDTTGTTSTRTTVGWVIGGVGVASLGVASYFGLHAFSRWSDRNAACVGGCTADAQSAGHDATQAATISDIGFGVGLAALAVGTYLVLSGRSEHDRHSSSTDDHSLRVAPSVGSRGGGVVVGGAW